MKYLEYPSLSRLNAFFSRADIGDQVVTGTLEAYSCKLAGMDKKLCKSLEQDVIDSLVSSPELASSPLGPLSEASSRKTLIYLILTLNHMYPDHDFTLLRASNFCKEPLQQVRSALDVDLMPLAALWEQQAQSSAPSAALGATLWEAIDEVISLNDCDVYSYVSDLDGDPFNDEGTHWSFNYFFYHRRLKRVLYFSCKARSRAEFEEDEEGMSDGAGAADDDDELMAVDDMD